ncbi:hypothetical protein J2W21_001917 [Sinomonas atrocyanea]|uniref:hypothetical protein n=1 Tax=Sinomonas atrocyanea TaxID=37927 RepID=UPI00277F1EA7|nr:hypothetical protein [Sinomonas atrocyanea]MDP9884404.1 hypothetical protein [Sinomonas atrocyanea]
MVDVTGMLHALRPEELQTLRSRGPAQILDEALLEAIDTAAGGPGEGRGYYVVHGHLWPVENREYHLRADVAEELFGPEAPA